MPSLTLSRIEHISYILSSTVHPFLAQVCLGLINFSATICRLLVRILARIFRSVRDWNSSTPLQYPCIKRGDSLDESTRSLSGFFFAQFRNNIRGFERPLQSDYLTLISRTVCALQLLSYQFHSKTVFLRRFSRSFWARGLFNFVVCPELASGHTVLRGIWDHPPLAAGNSPNQLPLDQVRLLKRSFSSSLPSWLCSAVVVDQYNFMDRVSQINGTMNTVKLR